MKVTVKECINAYNGIEGFPQNGIPGMRGQMPAILAYKLGRLLGDLKPIVREFDRAKEKIEEKYKEFMVEIKDQKTGRTIKRIQKEKEIEYQKEMNELGEVEEDREFYWVFLDDFRDPQNPDKWIQVDSTSMRLITPFLIEKKEEKKKEG